MAQRPIFECLSCGRFHDREADGYLECRGCGGLLCEDCAAEGQERCAPCLAHEAGRRRRWRLAGAAGAVVLLLGGLAAAFCAWGPGRPTAAPPAAREQPRAKGKARPPRNKHEAHDRQPAVKSGGSKRPRGGNSRPAGGGQAKRDREPGLPALPAPTGGLEWANDPAAHANDAAVVRARGLQRRLSEAEARGDRGAAQALRRELNTLRHTLTLPQLKALEDSP